jgi:hypothetical protein
MREPKDGRVNRCPARVDFCEQAKMPTRCDPPPDFPMGNRALADVEVIGQGRIAPEKFNQLMNARNMLHGPHRIPSCHTAQDAKSVFAYLNAKLY